MKSAGLQWLELYTDDAEFWIHAWDRDVSPTADPKSQLSLIYYDSKAGLEDRVWQLNAGMSLPSDRLIRTCHLISNVRLTESTETEARVSSHWQTHVYRP
jgi:3-phenylpropionate/cinnamic acid dioxygenase small subunit